MRSGQQVKKKLKDMIEENKKEEADTIARNCLKDCQNFIQLFKKNTKYYKEIENSIAELNALLDSLKEKPKENEDKKYFKTKIFSEDKRESATKIAEEDFKFDDIAKTAYGFEKAFNSFKKRLDVYFSYLKYIGFKNLPTMFKTNEMPYAILSGIIQTLKTFGIDSEENMNLSANFLNAISQTKNFNLLKKFLKKSDKQGILYLLFVISFYCLFLIFFLDLKDIFEKIDSTKKELLTFGEKNLEKIYL